MSEKEPMDFLRQIADVAPDGIAVCDAREPDHPLIYVNPAFELLTGYRGDELRGTNLRTLQGSDREQEGRARMREALAEGQGCRVLLRNYRKDGSQFWNELQLQPLRSPAGAVTHFVGYYKDASDRLKSDRPPVGLPVWMREDRGTGLASRPYFEELLARDWSIARREGRPLTLMLFDLDALTLYNEVFGRSGGDAAIRQVARALHACLRRSADLIARWDGGCIAVLAREANAGPMLEFARKLVTRVSGLGIHHPRSSVSRFVTVTGGIATLVPGYDEQSTKRLVDAAQEALHRAKVESRGNVLAAEESQTRPVPVIDAGEKPAEA